MATHHHGGKTTPTTPPPRVTSRRAPTVVEQEQLKNAGKPTTPKPRPPLTRPKGGIFRKNATPRRRRRPIRGDLGFHPGQGEGGMGEDSMPTPRSRAATERRWHRGCHSTPRVSPIRSPPRPTTKPATQGRRSIELAWVTRERGGRRLQVEIRAHRRLAARTAKPSAWNHQHHPPCRQGGVRSPEEAAATALVPP